jgi:hypothetical protein
VPATLTLITCEVAVKPLGPVQLYVNGPVPPVTEADIVAGNALAQLVGEFTLTTRVGLIVSVPEALPVQCVLLLSVTVTL